MINTIESDKACMKILSYCLSVAAGGFLQIGDIAGFIFMLLGFLSCHYLSEQG